MGKILWIDLTTGQTHIETFDDAYARKYLGGCGLGAKIVYGHATKNTNPLGAYNVLVFAAGPHQATDMDLIRMRPKLIIVLLLVSYIATSV